MDLDLALVRSFVVTAGELHFRRAAEHLLITQQALSQRVRRLETLLGAPLFVRSHRSVTLTDAGQRFLEPARQLLASAQAAVEAVRPGARRPLRADVVDGRLAPLRLVHRLAEEEPDLQVNLSMRQTLAAALPALLRGEIDCAFGRAHDATGRSAGLDHRLVRLEPLCALVPRGHPLAGRERVPVEELRRTGLWMPRLGEESEWQDYVRRMAGEFGIALTLSGPALSEEHFVQRLWEHREQVCLGGADVSYGYSSDIRCVPLDGPTPLYPWSVVWRRGDAHPLLPRLVELAGATDTERLAYDPEQHWLPAPDRSLLDSAPNPLESAPS